MTKRTPILSTLRKLKKPVFTTYELQLASGKSSSVVTQSLNHLAQVGVLMKIYRGVWAETGRQDISVYMAIPYLFSRQRAYVSFISALHLYGIIEQIPQMVTVASLTHTKTMRTSLGIVSVHRLAPELFGGFGWNNGDGSFLIAEPEKALFDSVYVSVCKKRRFNKFPELHFSKDFAWGKAQQWADKIPNAYARTAVKKKLDALKQLNRTPRSRR